MIYPKIFEMVKDDPAVQAEFGTLPMRFFPFGSAPQGSGQTNVYAVWQSVSGTPANTLCCPPDSDSWLVQVDVYGKDVETVRKAATALIECLENQCWVQTIRGETRDFETKNFRYSFDCNILQSRS